MDIDALVKSFNEEDKERFVSIALNAIENNEIEIGRASCRERV